MEEIVLLFTQFHIIPFHYRVMAVRMQAKFDFFFLVCSGKALLNNGRALIEFSKGAGVARKNIHFDPH